LRANRRSVGPGWNQLAPEDISIAAGETPFKPGPIVGDFQKAGIPAAIEGGKVVIKKDKTMVKAGEPISTDLALMLAKLEIFPLTVGMELMGAYEDGTVFKQDVLVIDDEKFMGDFLGAVSGGFNLACNIAYTTPLTINALLSKAQSDALNTALFAGITNKTTIKRLLALASGRMMALAQKVPDALDEELKNKISSASAAAAPVEAPTAEAKPEKKPKEEKKEVDEEEMAAGMGALFG